MRDGTVSATPVRSRTDRDHIMTDASWASAQGHRPKTGKTRSNRSPPSLTQIKQLGDYSQRREPCPRLGQSLVFPRSDGVRGCWSAMSNVPGPRMDRICASLGAIGAFESPELLGRLLDHAVSSPSRVCACLSSFVPGQALAWAFRPSSAPRYEFLSPESFYRYKPSRIDWIPIPGWVRTGPSMTPAQ